MRSKLACRGFAARKFITWYVCILRCYRTSLVYRVFDASLFDAGKRTRLISDVKYDGWCGWLLRTVDRTVI